MTQAKTPHMTDYEAERRNFSLEVPEYFNFASDVIGKWASYPIGHTITGKYWLDLHEDDLHWNLSEMGRVNYHH